VDRAAAFSSLGSVMSVASSVSAALHMGATTPTLGHTHTHGSTDFVRYNPGEPVPEETFTHSHSSWSSIASYLLHPSNTMASSLFNPRA